MDYVEKGGFDLHRKRRTMTDWWQKNGPTGRLDRSKHFLYPALPLDVTKAVKMALFMGIKTPSRAVVFSHYKKPSNHFRLASSWDRGAQWHCQIRSLVNQPIIAQTREAAANDGCSMLLKMIFCHFPIKIPIKVEKNYLHGKERS